MSNIDASAPPIASGLPGPSGHQIQITAVFISGVRGTRYRKNRADSSGDRFAGGKYAQEVVRQLSSCCTETDSYISCASVDSYHSFEPPVLTSLEHFNRGVLDLLEGRIQDAIRSFTASIELDPLHTGPCASAYANRGTAFNVIDRFSQALEDFDAALQIDAFMPEAHFGCGVAHLKLQDYELALADFSTCIKIDPGAPEYYQERALVLYLLNRCLEADEDLDAVLRIDANSVEGNFCKGVVQSSLGQLSSALKYMTRAIEIDKNYAPAYLVRSALYKISGCDLWIEDCHRAYELDNTLRLG